MTIILKLTLLSYGLWTTSSIPITGFSYNAGKLTYSQKTVVTTVHPTQMTYSAGVLTITAVGDGIFRSKFE